MKAFWRTPVYVLICVTAIVMIVNGSRQNFGLFLVPLSEDLGWGRQEFSFAVALQNLVIGLAAPIVAAMADKWGPVRVIASAGVIFAVGVSLIAFSTTPGTMAVTAGLIVGLGVSGCGMALLLALVGRVANDAQRSMWLGIVTAGASAGQFVFAPVNNGLITLFGWSGGLLFLALIVALVVPMAMTLSAGSESTLNQQSRQSLSEALAEAGRHRGYWLLVIGFFVCGFQVQFIGTHLPGYLNDAGQSSWLAATALATIGLFNLAGTLSAGWLGSRMSKKYLLSFLYLSRAALFLVFIQFPVTEVSVLMFSAILGLLWLSTVPLTSGIVAQIFGPRYMATLFAIVYLSHQLGSFCGVWFGGLFYDATGNYTAAWWMAIGVGVAAALIHWPIDEKPLARVAGEEAA